MFHSTWRESVRDGIILVATRRSMVTCALTYANICLMALIKNTVSKKIERKSDNLRMIQGWKKIALFQTETGANGRAKTIRKRYVWTRIFLLTKKLWFSKLKQMLVEGLNAEIVVKYISNNTSCSNHKAVSSLLDSEVQCSTLQEN